MMTGCSLGLKKKNGKRRYKFHFSFSRIPFLSFYNYIFAILSGGGKKGVAIRPYPSPGPPPFIPNAFIKCGTLTGSDSCWAASPRKESELGKVSSSPKKYLRPTQNDSNAKKPNTNQMPTGICTAKRRLWVDGDGAPGKGQRVEWQHFFGHFS